MKMYNSLDELPDNVQALSEARQRMWMEVFNSVFEETGNETMAFAAAWGAIEKGKSCTVKFADRAEGGVVQGWAMLFTDEDRPDLQDEYFDELTQTLLEYYPTAPLWMEHGYEQRYGSEPIGARSYGKIYRHGIWLEHELHADHPMYDVTVKDVKAGRLSYSSDSIGHYVGQGYDYEDGYLSIWPLAGCSLTRTPAEPGLGPVSLKSFVEALVEARTAQSEAGGGAHEAHDPAAETTVRTEAKSGSKPKSIDTRKDESTEVHIMNRQQMLEALKRFLNLGEDVAEEAVLDEAATLIAHLTPAPAKADGEGGDAVVTDAKAMVSDETVAALAQALGLGADASRDDVAAGMQAILDAMAEDAAAEEPAPMEMDLSALQEAANMARSASRSRTPYMVRVPAAAGDPSPVKHRGRFNVNRGAEPEQYPLAKMLRAHVDKDYSKAAKAVGSTGPTGGYLLNEMLSEEILDPLEAQEVVMAAGATIERFPGSEAFTVRKMESGATAYWAGPGQTVSDSAPAFGYVRIAPRELVARALIHRKDLRNSDARLEQKIRDALIKALALEMDHAFLYGTGGLPAATGHSGAEPLGLNNVTGVTATSLGTNGATPKLTDIENMIGRLEDDNVMEDDTWGWIFHPRSKRTFTNMKDNNGQPILRRDYMSKEEKEILGYPYFTTTQVGKAETVGSNSDCSRIFLGKWSDFCVGISLDQELVVDESRYVNEREVLIQVVTYVDCGVFYPEAFEVLTGVRA